MAERVVGRRRFLAGAGAAVVAAPVLAAGKAGELVGQSAYTELGEQFEDQERRVLGESGFEGAVKEVAKLEEALGIHDLARFTP